MPDVRRAMGLPEPVSETEALQQRIAELEAENARLRGEDPNPQGRFIAVIPKFLLGEAE